MRAFLILLPMSCLLISCKSSSCIGPAVEQQKIKDTKVIEAAAKLEKLQTSANIKTDFSNELDQNFGKLSDANTELFLFLTAIECYLSHGQIGQEIARDLAQGVRAKYLAAKPPIASASFSINSLEQGIIRQGGHAEPILGKYRSLGFKVD